MRTEGQERGRFHWQESFKFVIEATKGLFALNGSAAIAILTFIGHHRDYSTGPLAKSLTIFAIGALMAPITFLMAYLAELYYGNSDIAGTTTYGWKAILPHRLGVITFVVGLLLFVWGVSVAKDGFSIPQ